MKHPPPPLKSFLSIYVRRFISIEARYTVRSVNVMYFCLSNSSTTFVEFTPPKLLSKPRQTLVFKHHLNNDRFFLQQFDRVFQWQYLEQRLLSWDTFLRGSQLPTSVLSLQNDITCCIINLPPHPLLVIVSSDHKYSQQRTSYQTGKWQGPLEKLSNF